jgi:hypothetical protein
MPLPYVQRCVLTFHSALCRITVLVYHLDSLSVPLRLVGIWLFSSRLDYQPPSRCGK